MEFQAQEEASQLPRKIKGLATTIFVGVLIWVVFQLVILLLTFFELHYYLPSSLYLPVFTLVPMLMVGGLLIAVIGSAIFLYNANKNVRAAGAKELQFTSNWAVGIFFTPVINLIVGFSVVSELYRASKFSLQAAEHEQWRDLRTPFIFYLWAFCWLLGWVLLLPGPREMLFESLPLYSPVLAFFLFLLTFLIQWLAGIFWVVIVRKILKVQVEMFIPKNETN